MDTEARLRFKMRGVVILCSALIMLLGTCKTDNSNRQSNGKDDLMQLVIEQWEPLTIVNIASDLKVDVSRLDTLIMPWDVSSNKEYLDLLGNLSFRLRRGYKTVIGASTSLRYSGVWHLDTLRLAVSGGKYFHVALLYMLRDSLVHYPACVVASRTTGSAYINMDVVGRFALRRQYRLTLDSALLSSRTYDPFCAEVKEMESKSDSLVAAYFDRLRVVVWPAK